ncbi:S-adenosyl-L-methionine-dependent methyltransferase [Exidia glandulosa HHB12029]|uniref:S-adenosyl-L-methionine-dependent methyltransferase n=1 Tax=Exidia glandulosa HHB12029 TaxID=1314781 RepID=A0A165LS48_EXIGL|nr:S-adenosyl-L-methionine-dependent methyltransferase [Exidia glandulosa HHB12029]
MAEHAGDSHEAVAQLYDSIAASEADRLRLHPMERELTLDAIATHIDLTRRNDRLKVADIGGATGVYAFKLADAGAEVHLRDLSSRLVWLANVEQERRANDGKPTLASAAVGSALDTELLPTKAFDVVLLLGPGYHLVSEGERILAVQNALSFLRDDTGRVFAAFIPRQAHMRDIAKRDPSRLVREREFYETYLRTGQYVKPGRSSYHVGSLDEVRQLVAAAGGKLVELLGVESILGGGNDAGLVEANEDVLSAWVHVLKPYARREENLGAADHWLAVIAKGQA